MKGYKATNGNYITGKELERQKRKWQKELKEYRKQKQEEEKRQQHINNLLYLQEKREQKEEQYKWKKLMQQKTEFINSIGKYQIPYKQFLIIWDLFHNDLLQIKSDYIKQKINRNDITAILNILPDSLITDYQKEFINNL